MVPSSATATPLRREDPGYINRKKWLSRLETEKRTVSVSTVKSTPSLMTLPSGLYSSSPSRLVPIHLGVCTLPSGLMSETYPSFLEASVRSPEFIAKIRFLAGSKVQLSAKWKLPKTFTLSDISTQSPASLVVPKGFSKEKSWACICAKLKIAATEIETSTRISCEDDDI